MKIRKSKVYRFDEVSRLKGEMSGTFRMWTDFGNCYVGSSRDVIRTWKLFVNDIKNKTNHLINQDNMKFCDIESIAFELMEEANCCFSLKENKWLNELNDHGKNYGIYYEIMPLSKEEMLFRICDLIKDKKALLPKTWLKSVLKILENVK